MDLRFPATDEVWFQSGNVAAVFSPNSSGVESGILVVTFTALVEGPLRDGLSRETLRKTGIDAVHVVPKGNDWYQYDEMPALLDQIKIRSTAYSEIVTYGLSMGGTAALQSSGQLSACRTVTYAPQFSVDRKRVPFDPGWQDRVSGLDFVWDDFDKNVSKDAQHIIAYDPRMADRRHVGEIQKRVPVVPLRIPFGGHHVWHTLNQAGIGSTALAAMIRGDFDLQDIRSSLRKARRNDVRYWMNIARTTSRWRDSAIQHAIVIDSENPALRKLVAEYHPELCR